MANIDIIIDNFERQVDRSPKSTALVLESGEVFSYLYLDDISTRIGQEIACALSCIPSTSNDQINHGGSDTPLVAVMMARGVGIVSSFLGILKAGAAYVPVDPAFPPDRQTHIFQQSKCQLLVTDASSYEAAIKLGVNIPPTLVIDSSVLNPDGIIGNIVAKYIKLPSFEDFDKDSILAEAKSKVYDRQEGGLAYVLYTSGSTGKPKGVMVRQDGVVKQIFWFADEMNVGPHSRVLSLATFCFDISVLEMYLPLLTGGTQILAYQSSQKDPFRLLDVIQEYRVNVMQATPTTYEMFFAIGWTGDKSIDFLVGGEAFRPSLIKLVDNCRSLRNLYGPTETTIWASSNLLPPRSSQMLESNGVKIIPVGYPLCDKIFYLVSLDEPKRLVGDGEEGELWIGGVGVTPGYLNAPELTEKLFIPNPFGEGFVYLTGDLIKRIHDGKGPYLFVRRIDDQVKIDGFRIELGEIETVFATHPLIDTAIAVVKDGKLILYVKKANNGLFKPKMSQDELRNVFDFAARSLMYYMMPKNIVFVEKFPMGATNKIDRKALPPPPPNSAVDFINLSHGGLDDHHSASRVVIEIQPVRNSFEKKAIHILSDHICSLIERVRGRRPLPGTSFASIGVDSLGAVLFVKQLSESLGGIRIIPTALYSPGVTIKSFSEGLFDRLLKESPSSLTNLGIYLQGDDVEHGQGNDDNDNYEEDITYEGVEEVQRLEASFDEILMSNRLTLEGLRGIFMFLVIYDHYHNPRIKISPQFQVDVFLFMVLSGLTTSFQLRETPVFEKRPQHIEGPRPYVLKARSDFKIIPFMVTRMVGLYPILWLALLLHIPLQLKSDKYNSTNPSVKKVAECQVLYIFALQSWLRPQCRVYGPNYVLYASIIFVVCIYYAILRKGLVLIQNYVMQWSSTEYDPVTLKAHVGLDEVSDARKRSWKTWISDMMLRLTYNRADMGSIGFTTFLYATAGQTCFLLVALFTNPKNAVIFFPHFMAGVIAAALLECVHCAIWDFQRKRRILHEARANSSKKGCVDAIEMGRRIEESPLAFIVDVITFTEFKPMFPWVHSSNLFGVIFYKTMPDPSKSASHSEETLQANRLSENRPKTTFFWVCCQLWRFLPDFIAVITGCLFANWKITTRKYIAPAMQFIFIPSGFIALIFILMLQRGSARFNLSRWFLGIHPVTTMGYASYALYLFQEPAFGFWAPYFYLAAPKGIGITEPIPEGDWYPVTKNFKVIRVLWFWNEPLGKQFLGVVVLQLICWLIHKYYQDKFVPFVYEKMHQCVAVCFKAKVYHNKLPTKNNLPIQNKELGDDLNNNWQPVFIASKTVV